jgi:hypothetical protein
MKMARIDEMAVSNPKQFALLNAYHKLPLDHPRYFNECEKIV